MAVSTKKTQRKVRDPTKTSAVNLSNTTTKRKGFLHSVWCSAHSEQDHCQNNFRHNTVHPLVLRNLPTEHIIIPCKAKPNTTGIKSSPALPNKPTAAQSLLTTSPFVSPSPCLSFLPCFLPSFLPCYYRHTIHCLLAVFWQHRRNDR